MEKMSVVGTWKLVSSVEAHNVDGDVLHVYGEDPFGMLMYAADGHMSVLLMRRGRARFASGDPLGGAPEEIKEAFEGFDAYSGTYSVDTEQGTVTHHIKGGRFPNWEGTDQVRFFALAGNQLQLRTPPIAARGTEWVIRLIWERAA